MQNLIAQLKQMKHSEVKPSEAWLKNNRALLLSQIKNTVNTENQKISLDNVWNTMSLFIPRTLVFSVVRPMAVLLVVSIVATSGWITSVDAAYNSLPGDWLYGAKRVAEKTQVAVASLIGSKTDQTMLHSEFAKRRATETKQIIAGNDPQKQQKVQEVVNDLKIEIASVSRSLDEMQSASSSDSSVTADTVKDLKQDTEQVKDTLQEVKTTLLVASTAADTSSTIAVAQAVNDARDLAKDTTVKAVEVIVAKHLEGDTSVSTAEVKQEIASSLQAVTTDASQSQQSMQNVQAVVTAAKVEAKDVAIKAIADKTTVDATTTAALNEKISKASTAANDAAAQTQTVVDSVDKTVTEANTLLDKGDLTKVVEKIKEANTATKEAEKISNQAVTDVAQIAPIVSILPAVVTGTSTSVGTDTIKLIVPPKL